ncbi:MAG TPA: phosphopyruvate hydratase [bacterium]|nr:phosphopyruvate hydratase [bacterium]
MSLISSVTAFKYLNSRARWTVCARVQLDDGVEVIQTVPDGASKGAKEAIALPVEEAIQNINIVIAPALIGLSPLDQKNIDDLLIKMAITENKSGIGANATLAVSLAVARAASRAEHKSLYLYIRDLFNKSGPLVMPTPVFNILNGGLHAQNGLSFQEFMLIPGMNFSYEHKVEIGVDVYNKLRTKLQEKGYGVGLGDEGGFAPEGFTTRKALEFLISSIEAAGYVPGKDAFLGMDVAAGSFYDKKSLKYEIKEESLSLSALEMSSYYSSLLKDFPIIYLEDPLYEDALDDWYGLYKALSKRTMIVGDDLVVTNSSILKKALDPKCLNAVIVKPNQIGTLSETLEFMRLAQNNDLVTIVSHRSGDTAEDTFVSDLALGTGAEFVKFGAPARGERVVKYNRLLDLYHRI